MVLLIFCSELPAFFSNIKKVIINLGRKITDLYKKTEKLNVK